MQVYSEASPAGGGKKIGVTLDDSDMADVEDWDSLGVAVKHKRMSDRADMLLVALMVRRGDISQEYAEQRIREIQQGFPS